MDASSKVFKSIQNVKPTHTEQGIHIRVTLLKHKPNPFGYIWADPLNKGECIVNPTPHHIHLSSTS